MKNLFFFLTLTLSLSALAGCEKNYIIDENGVGGNGTTGSGPNYVLGDAYLDEFVDDAGSDRACMIDFDGDLLWDLISLMSCVNKDYQMVEVRFYNGISLETSPKQSVVLLRESINNIRTAQGFGGKARILKLSLMKHDNFIGFGSVRNTGFGNCSYKPAPTATATQYEVRSWSTVQ